MFKILNLNQNRRETFIFRCSENTIYETSPELVEALSKAEGVIEGYERRATSDD